MRGKVVLALFIATLVGCASALPNPGFANASAAGKGSRSAAEVKNQAESRANAVLDARKRLEALEVPPSSEAVPALPNRLRLSGPGVTIGSRNFLDLGSLWVTPEDPDEVLSWFRGHPPLGSVLSESGSFGIRKEIVARELGFEFPELPGIASSRYLRISVVSRGSAGSAFRADSQAVWLLPHPVNEQIPAAAAVLEAKLLVGGVRKRSDLVTDQDKVAAIAELIDRLLPLQPFEGSSGFCCGEEAHKKRELVLVFRRDRQGPALAEVTQTFPPGFSNWLEVTIRGKREPGLEEGQILIEKLREEGILLR